MALVVKNPPDSAGDRKAWVRSLGQEDPLEEEMEIHSSILAWQIPWTEKILAGYSPWGHKRVRHNLAAKTTTELVN